MAGRWSSLLCALYLSNKPSMATKGFIYVLQVNLNRPINVINCSYEYPFLLSVIVLCKRKIKVPPPLTLFWNINNLQSTIPIPMKVERNRISSERLALTVNIWKEFHNMLHVWCIQREWFLHMFPSKQRIMQQCRSHIFLKSLINLVRFA